MFASKSAGPLFVQPARGMATEKQLRGRIKSVTNIKKITNAMKMVAACRLRASQKQCEVSREFEKDVAKLWPTPKEDVKPENRLLIGISSDRGLCGAINTSIVRAIRDEVVADKTSNKKILLFGEKARQGLERGFGRNFTTTISNSGNNRPVTFRNVQILADFWLAQPFDRADVFFQYFKSMIAYKTTLVQFPSYAAASKDLSFFNIYEMEGDNDILQNFHEFRIAVSLFRFAAENETSTLSSRMQAMDNSNKNAGEMVVKLRLLMNRSRQAKITTELVEIISGAIASEEMTT
jgi:F-type H+-transporting ATPase subunit gamma